MIHCDDLFSLKFRIEGGDWLNLELKLVQESICVPIKLVLCIKPVKSQVPEEMSCKTFLFLPHINFLFLIVSLVFSLNAKLFRIYVFKMCLLNTGELLI